jgi:multiple sugar transport system permease protein
LDSVRKKKKLSRRQWKDIISGYLFISPWLLGLLIFTIGPILASFLISFCKWPSIKGLSGIEWIGFNNYIELLGFSQYDSVWEANDPLFWQSLKVTFFYTLFSVPLGIIFAILLAILMNQKVRGIRIFRTIFYLPSITAGVATAVLWRWLLNQRRGLLNNLLGSLGLPERFWPGWLTDPDWTLSAYVLMSLWGVGGMMIIYLASLQGIPRHLYESAEIDGAGLMRKFWNVTLPMLTPTIFFNLIIAIIGSFQVFTQAYIIGAGTSGAPNNASLFYVIYLYRHAFGLNHMGYASAMAWILFIIIFIFTLIQFQHARKWVYYEGGER